MAVIICKSQAVILLTVNQNVDGDNMFSSPGQFTEKMEPSKGENIKDPAASAANFAIC